MKKGFGEQRQFLTGQLSDIIGFNTELSILIHNLVFLNFFTIF